MNLDFAGKRVLITGSTTGIGRAAAEMFHAAGAVVAINGRDPATVAKAVREIGQGSLVECPGDLSTAAGCNAVVTRALDSMGGIDCLVNNVGIRPLSRLMDVTESHWDEVISVNLQSALFCTAAALNALRLSKGNIVMVSSISGLVAGPTDRFVYSVSAAGLVGMTRTLALELAADKIRVNCLCPGYVDTPMVRAENAATKGQIDEWIQKVMPLGRLSTARECASSILYLASDEAAYCTGSTLVNDGGCAANACWGTR